MVEPPGKHFFPLSCQHLHRCPIGRLRRAQCVADPAGALTDHQLRAHASRKRSSIPVNALAQVPSASGNPPTHPSATAPSDAALPTFPLARAPIPHRRIDHPGPHQRPISRRLRGHRRHPAFRQLEHQPPRPPRRARPTQLQQRRLHRRRHLMRTTRRPMRPIH